MSKIGVKKSGGRCDECGKMGRVAAARGPTVWCSDHAHLAPPVPYFNRNPPNPKNEGRPNIRFQPGREEGETGDEG